MVVRQGQGQGENNNGRRVSGRVGQGKARHAKGKGMQQVGRHTINCNGVLQVAGRGGKRGERGDGVVCLVQGHGMDPAGEMGQ